jgi:hypothetical protein
MDLMTLKALLPLVLGALLALGACTNPFDPSQKAVGGGLYPQSYQQGVYNPSPSPPGATGGPHDLADMAAGVYYGNVISDARGAGRSGVTVIVAKRAPNTVSVTSNYGRLPPFTIRLTRAMNTIQQVGTSVVFLLDLSKGPYGLDVTDDEASWSGSKG